MYVSLGRDGVPGTLRRRRLAISAGSTALEATLAENIASLIQYGDTVRPRDSSPCKAEFSVRHWAPHCGIILLQCCVACRKPHVLTRHERAMEAGKKEACRGVKRAWRGPMHPGDDRVTSTWWNVKGRPRSAISSWRGRQQSEQSLRGNCLRTNARLTFSSTKVTSCLTSD
jgi:hypothetical protein